MVGLGEVAFLFRYPISCAYDHHDTGVDWRIQPCFESEIFEQEKHFAIARLRMTSRVVIWYEAVVTSEGWGRLTSSAHHPGASPNTRGIVMRPKNLDARHASRI